MLKIVFKDFEISKFSELECAQSPSSPRKRGATAPCWYCRLLYSNLLATSIFNETPEKFLRVHYFWAVLYQAYWYEIEMKQRLLM